MNEFRQCNHRRQTWVAWLLCLAILGWVGVAATQALEYEDNPSIHLFLIWWMGVSTLMPGLLFLIDDYAGTLQRNERVAMTCRIKCLLFFLLLLDAGIQCTVFAFCDRFAAATAAGTQTQRWEVMIAMAMIIAHSLLWPALIVLWQMRQLNSQRSITT